MATCWGSNSFCGPNNPDRYIKIWDNKVVAIEGNKILSQIDLCKMRIPFVNHQSNTYLIKAGQTSQVLDWGSVGDLATMILISPQYDLTALEKGTDNYLIWSFVDEADSYPLKEIMWLTGDRALGLKKIKVTNPSSYDVRLNIMVVGLEGYSSNYGTSDVVSNFAFNNLVLNQIRTWSSQTIYVGSGPSWENTELFIQIDRIGAIERSGRFVVIDDDSIGEIFLGMDDEISAKQLVSALNYLVNHKPTHGTDFTLPMPSDLTPPEITWNPSVTSPSLGVYETNMFLGGYMGNITAQNIIDHAVQQVLDLRDGVVNLIPSDVQIMSGVNTVPSITAIGTFLAKFTLRDIAENSIVVELNLNVLA